MAPGAIRLSARRVEPSGIYAPVRSYSSIFADKKYRGERLRSALLSGFRCFCGHFAVTQTGTMPSVAAHSASRLSARRISAPSSVPSASAKRISRA